MGSTCDLHLQFPLYSNGITLVKNMGGAESNDSLKITLK